MIYALDTNIISYLLKDDEKVYSRYCEALAKGDFCVIPLVVYYEVLRGLEANNAINKLHLFENLCDELDIIELTIADAVTAARIYSINKHRGTPVDDADLLIAAQVITHEYTLITNNIKHFSGIDDLVYDDWTA